MCVVGAVVVIIYSGALVKDPHYRDPAWRPRRNDNPPRMRLDWDHGQVIQTFHLELVDEPAFRNRMMKKERQDEQKERARRAGLARAASASAAAGGADGGEEGVEAPDVIEVGWGRVRADRYAVCVCCVDAAGVGVLAVFSWRMTPSSLRTTDSHTYTHNHIHAHTHFIHHTYTHHIHHAHFREASRVRHT